MKKYVLRKRIFLTLTVLLVTFIFGQSATSFSASEEQSGRIVRWMLRLFSSVGIHFEPEPFHLFVRKAAHFVEFALLGICVGGYSHNLGHLRARRFWALPGWFTLAVAVCDEFIQSFTGRGSTVADVVLDYAGSLFGLLLAAAFVFIENKITRRKKHEN